MRSILRSAWAKALDFALVEPSELGYTPEKAATVRLVVNLLTKEYDQWQRCNLEVWNKRTRDDIEGGHPYDLRHAVYQEIHRAFESIGLEVFPRSDSVAQRNPAPLAHLLPKKPWQTKDEAIAWAQSILETSAGKKKRAAKAAPKVQGGQGQTCCQGSCDARASAQRQGSRQRLSERRRGARLKGARPWKATAKSPSPSRQSNGPASPRSSKVRFARRFASYTRVKRTMRGALEAVGIALEFDNYREETGAAHTIAISIKESLALVKLQGDIWRKGIMAGCSVQAVVDQLLDASLAFLGIKVKAAPKRAKASVRLRAA